MLICNPEPATPDDWRGERFLKIERPVGKPKIPPEQRTPKKKRIKAKRGAICSVTGCENTTVGTSTTTVCYQHPHRKPYCQCKICKTVGRGLAGACDVPGCGNRLKENNVSRVCRKHNHKKPYCKCKKCKP